jgi:hypothetical protein
MDQLLERLAQTRRGLFTSEDANGCGLDRNDLSAMISTGRIRRLRRGLYLLEACWPKVGESASEQRHRLLAEGVLTQYRGKIAASHHTALVLATLPTWGVPHSAPRFVRVSGRHTEASADLRIGRAWPIAALTSLAGFPLVRAGLASLMTAMCFGVESGVVSLDAALATGVTDAIELEHWMGRLRGHRNCRRARRALSLADGRSESPGESRLRVSLHALGYEGLEPQVVVRGGDGFTARVDLFDHEHQIALEFDGSVKYQGVDGKSALMREKHREDELRSLGIGFARFTWADLDKPDLLVAKMNRARRIASR